MPKFSKINHVTLLVQDKVKAEKFYTDILDLEKHRVGKHLWLKIGNQFIHVTQNSGVPISNSFYHFAIEVESLGRYLKEIISKGVEVFDLDDNFQPILVNQELEKENRNFFIRDIDGNLIEFIDTSNSFFNPIKIA